MRKVNFDRLVIDELNDLVRLVKSQEIEQIVENDGDYTNLYRLDDDGIIVRAGDVLTRADFDDNLFEEYYSTCDSKKKVEHYYDYYNDEPQPYVKANWDDYDKHLRFASQHGINTSYYWLGEDAQIIEGTCYEADDYIPQSYPTTEQQDAFKFVANDGEVYYIKRTSPFFSDQCDDFFELITQEEFESFEN